MRRVISVFLGLTCFAVVQVVTFAQQREASTVRPAPVGSAVIAGVIWADAEQARPVRRAVVTLTGTDISTAHTTVTNDAGQFVFDTLSAGRYVLMAEKPAHVTMHYGSPALGRGPGTPIAIADGQRIEVAMRLPRGAVLSGVLRDEAGRPIASGQVQVSSAVRLNGEVHWQSVRTQVPIVTTDEQGRYRIYGLAPGEYVVRGSAPAIGDARLMTPEALEAADRELQRRARGQAVEAEPDPAPRVAWVPAFAPGVADRRLAQAFVLREGQEYNGADITLSLGRVARVTGSMVGPDGGPAVTPRVGIINTRERTTWTSLGGVPAGAQGAFVLPAIGPGEYAFVGRSGESLYAMTPFVVLGDDIADLRIEFSPGGIVTGRVEGLITSVQSTARLTLTPVDAIAGVSMGTPTAAPDGSGAFRFDGVPPGRYRIAATGLGALHLQSVWLDDRDTLDGAITVGSGETVDGLRVVVSNDTTVLTGTLSDQLGRPSPEFAVVVFSTDRAHWLSAPRRMSGVVRLDSQGRYRITGLPPGTYHLAAVTDASPQLLADSTFLEELAANAVTVTLARGQETRQDLKLSGG